MTDRSDKLRKLNYIFALTPIFGVVVYAIFAGQSPFKVFLPYESGNDSWFYYKQIEAIIYKLYPRGFFSYNESMAVTGAGFGVWNPLVYVPYAIVGRIIGWNYYSPLIVNLLFLCSAFYLWCRLTDCSIKANLIICLTYCFSFPITRYLYSGMIEGLYYALVVVYAAVILSKLKDNTKYAILIIVTGFLVCLRPYFILLSAFLFLDFKGIKKKAGTVISTLIALFLYYYIRDNFCSKYFFQRVEKGLYGRILSESKIGGLIMYFINRFIDGVKEILSYLTGYIYGTAHDMTVMIGMAYLVMLVIIVILFVMVIMSIVRKDKAKIWPLFFTLVVNAGYLLAIMLLYRIEPGSRHLLIAFLIDYLIIGYYSDKYQKYFMLAAVICLFIRLDFVYPIAFGSYCENVSELKSVVKERTIAFNELMPLSDGVTWENTVVCTFPETKDEPFYSVPRGMGITICESYGYLAYEEIKSKYIISAPGKSDFSDKFSIIYSDDTCVLWQRK